MLELCKSSRFEKVYPGALNKAMVQAGNNMANCSEIEFR